jgi:hypothetical protein
VRSLKHLASDVGASAVHGVPHGTDFLAAHAAAQDLGVPYYLSVHDDLRHTARARPDRATLLSRLGHVWRSATHRFVISEELGEEYERRYGNAAWDLISDAAKPAPTSDRPRGSCAVYFNSSFVPYRANFAALISALGSLSEQAVDARLILRGADEPAVDWPVPVPLELLPFANDQQVALDYTRADVLYLPLPFEPEMVDLVRWSLSTKMVGFLAAGRPILYHGPRQAAAARLLGEHGAAVIVDSLEPSRVRAGLQEALDHAPELVANAYTLLRHRFDPAQVRHRFWQILLHP